MFPLLVAVPLFVALVGYVACGGDERRYYWTALSTCALVFALSVGSVLAPDGKFFLPLVCDQGLSLETDGFRKVYILVISFMWMMTMALSKDYFSGHHKLYRYYFFSLMTLGSTMGVFLASNLYTAFVFFEVMSFTSFPWVIQEETDGAIRAANTYLAVAVVGGLTALMGIFLVHWKLGTTEVALLYERAVATGEKNVFYAAGVCILVGFGAKAGMFPLHIWLPKAHPVAPAPASALLSGVLTKSGIWGVLALSCNLFRHDEKWGALILLLGTITMFMGALLALFSIDLKRTLACSSMSQIGFVLVGVGMMCLLGEENALAARGTILHMVNHSLFKLVLFMCAGVVYMNAHQLDLNEIQGFGRKKPLLAVIFLLGALGIGGIPGLNGYISKTLLHESIVEGAVEYGVILKVVEWIFLLSGGLTLSYMTKLFVCIFLEKGKGENVHSHFNGRYMSPLSTVALVGSAALLPILGLSAEWSMNGIADAASRFLHSGHLEHHVHFYSLENLKGAVISVAIAVVVYLLVVRKWMIRDGEYVDRWPKKLDLEDLVYRPLLLKVLPAIFGFLASFFGENKLSKKVFRWAMDAGAWFSRLLGDNVVTGALAKLSLRVSGILARVFSDMTDALVFALRATVYRESPAPNPDKYELSLSYRAGAKVDMVRRSMGKAKEGEEHKYARYFFEVVNTLRKTTHNLTDTLSFALLMLCLAFFVVMLYVIFIY